MNEIHQLQDQLNCLPLASPSRVSFNQNKDFMRSDRLDFNDDSNLLSNNNMMLNNDLSGVPLDGVDNTSYY